MNKKIIFFIISLMHSGLIFTSNKNKSDENNRSLAVQIAEDNRPHENNRSVAVQIATIFGKTLTDILQKNSQETHNTTRLDNNCSWSCCCCCNFKNITSWFFSEREESSTSDSNQNYSPYDPARTAMARAAFDTQETPNDKAITEF